MSTLSVRSFGLSDRGRRRTGNEDQFLIAELTKTMRISHTTLGGPPDVFGDERGHLFLVADGMGGHNAGERASALAVAIVEQFTLNSFKWFLEPDEPASGAVAEFESAIHEADAAIVRESSHRPELQGMGTTLTMAYAVGTRLFILHVGDSRAYLHRDAVLTQLTEDHTVVAEMVRRGEIAPAQADRHRLRHVITNVIGGGNVGVQADVRVLDLQAGDTLLLCSDGLNETMSREEIAEMLSSGDDAERTSRRLVTLANERGGPDNITVIVSQFGSLSEDTLEATRGAGGP
jgi:serine/threonine protein phosphatase PrpC